LTRTVMSTPKAHAWRRSRTDLGGCMADRKDGCLDLRAPSKSRVHRRL
jgi:hypothetical protein